MSWLPRWFRRAEREHDLDRELAFHVDTRTEELMRDGHTRDEARRLALAEFGGYTPIREVTRDASGGRWLTDLWQDLKYTRRVLWANKTFTAAAVASLAIGLGANAAVFRVMDSLMFRPLPVESPNELFYVVSESAGESRFSHPAYLRLAEGVANQAQLTASSSGMTVQVTVNGVEQLVAAQLVAGNWFETLGVSPSAGRLLSPEDDRMNGSEGVAVMSDRTWTRHFARNPSVVGSTLMVNGAPVTVVGIAEPGFDGVFVASPMGLWMPTAAQPFIHAHPNVGNDNGDDTAPWMPQDGISWLSVWGRQQPGASRDAITRRLEDRYAQVLATRYESVEDPERRARLTSDRITVLDGAHGLSGTRERLGPALTILLGMSALVLIVSCANLANLLLVRGVARQREFSLRLAIGASRGRLIRQLLAESVALAALGGGAWTRAGHLGRTTAAPRGVINVDARAARSSARLAHSRVRHCRNTRDWSPVRSSSSDPPVEAGGRRGGAWFSRSGPGARPLSRGEGAGGRAGGVVVCAGRGRSVVHAELLSAGGA